ncbi:hypothetical protein [Streptomyces sp. TRM68367]|uniref:hypothetical protein n=1 Tax=Streptomyces sp. TRM68367 TaxID=2758415 RepID=UPI0019B2955C|nr:hypothetical protein [Streptomyces sp. TRM68367]MBC9723968.1 hypothetical protein [Streptomyces sp. TRM68367]
MEVTEVPLGGVVVEAGGGPAEDVVVLVPFRALADDVPAMVEEQCGVEAVAGGVGLGQEGAARAQIAAGLLETPIS